MAANPVALFVGQNALGQPVLRIPKDGSPIKVLVDAVDSVDYLAVHEGQLFFSEASSVRMVAVDGGSQQVLAEAARPAGLDVTARAVYFAENLAARLVRIDRQTLVSEVLGSQPQEGIYRVAAAEDVGLVHFSSSHNGIRRYDLDYDWFDSIVNESASARAARIFGDYLYFVLPASGKVYRMPPDSVDSKMIADLSPLGVHADGLDSDGAHLYMTLEFADGNGLIVRVATDGGTIEVVADAQGSRPAALAVDGECVYWQGCSLKRLAV